MLYELLPHALRDPEVRARFAEEYRVYREVDGDCLARAPRELSERGGGRAGRREHRRGRGPRHPARARPGGLRPRARLARVARRDRRAILLLPGDLTGARGRRGIAAVPSRPGAATAPSRRARAPAITDGRRLTPSRLNGHILHRIGCSPVRLVLRRHDRLSTAPPATELTTPRPGRAARLRRPARPPLLHRPGLHARGAARPARPGRRAQGALPAAVRSRPSSRAARWR